MIIEMLLARAADINDRDIDDYSAIIVASRLGFLVALDFFIKRGLRPR